MSPFHRTGAESSANTLRPGLTNLVQSRHSVRAFTSQPVPTFILEDCLALAQTSPSNSNIQPWHITVLTDRALTRVSEALLEAVNSGITPSTVPVPQQYKHYQSEMGHQLYGKDGYNVAREDKEAAERARRRNYSFFGAPMALIVSMDRRLANVDVLSVGLYLHTLCLLLAERGVATSYQVSVVGYPEVLRRELELGEDMEFLTGVAVGFEDPKAHINGLRIEKEDWREKVDFMQS